MVTGVIVHLFEHHVIVQLSDGLKFQASNRELERIDDNTFFLKETAAIEHVFPNGRRESTTIANVAVPHEVVQRALAHAL